MISLRQSPEYSTHSTTSLMQPATADHPLSTQNQAPLMCKGEIASLKHPPRLSLPLKKRPYCANKSLPFASMPVVKLSVSRGPKTLTKPSRPSLSLVSSSSTSKPKKSVRFSKVQKTRILKKRNLTPQDRERMWYQMADYAAIDQDSIKNLKALEQVDGDLARLNHDEYCIRGLEMKTSPHINRLRRLRAKISVRAVLDTQNHNRKMLRRQNADEALAAVSQHYTTKAQSRARELGVIDAMETALR
ncbi:expressed unknown protein [Seminavis robusta]|uniref:Uncharacterized protein n=1 Tax=Seminavis robusta TaxID=568900 RepID=A0A9N8HS99_9STRA|nr:expressed unknown protein [Seminavis robusta]|eukprot:Sro1495_g277450.1 n/a (246) ;mRNA; r:16438-17175